MRGPGWPQVKHKHDVAWKVKKVNLNSEVLDNVLNIHKKMNLAYREKYCDIEIIILIHFNKNRQIFTGRNESCRIRRNTTRR